MKKIVPDIRARASERKSGFTLVELMIVVAVLGILAAIVIPEFSGHIQQAKEAAAKDTLRTLRNFIERYALEHNDVPPGYPSDDPSNTPSKLAFGMQLRDSGYLTDDPYNPFNDKYTVELVLDVDAFPETPTGNSGWYYKPSTREIRLNWAGTDSEGILYLSY